MQCSAISGKLWIVWSLPSNTRNMSKSLAELCMFCIASNLQNVSRLGTFLSKNDNEVLLELLCDHDMFTGNNMPHITYQLLTSRLENIAFRYSNQVDDTLLQNVALCGCKLKSFTLKECPVVSGIYWIHTTSTSISTVIYTMLTICFDSGLEPTVNFGNQRNLQIS